MRYVFREDEPVRIKGARDADAQVIGAALEEIRVAAGGELEPSAVVSAARSSSNVLHRHFEWDDRIAAEGFRIDQARGLIRIVRVVDENTEEGSARAFISIKSDHGTSYRALGDVKRSRDLSTALLAQAERELAAFELRYKELKEICEIVASARKAISRRRSKHESRVAA